MVGTKKALAYAASNVTVTKRNTLLKERLSDGLISYKKKEKVIYPVFGDTLPEQPMAAEPKMPYGTQSVSRDSK